MDEVEIPEETTRVILRPAVALALGVVVGVGVGIAVAAALTAVGKEYGDQPAPLANVIVEEEKPVDQIVIEE